ncbi:MAG TPA: hypothetical protein VL501_08560 [Pyrinomonadaceae bacterium]|nr:hypothetical protein [Pyrinomonadaceae bacterium]
MKKSLTILGLVATFALGVFAQNSRQVQDAVRSLNSKLDDVEQSFRYQMQGNSAPRQEIDLMTDQLQELRNAVLNFEDQLERHRENRDDARKIVDATQRLDATMQDAATNKQMERDWKAVRDQVDRLAREYGVVTRWNTGVIGVNDQFPTSENPQPRGRTFPQTMPPTRDNGSVTVGLAGTYTLDKQASENVDDIVRGTQVSGDQQDDLRDKLEAPDQIAIEVRGTQVTLATSNAAAVAFQADGRDKTETANGRTIKLRATLSGNTLVISSVGGDTDYNITFTSTGNGRGLKVSRRITTDYLNQTVFAESVYSKTDATARLDIGGGSSPVVVDNNNATTSSTGSTTTDTNGGYSDNDNSGAVSNGGSGAGGYNNGTGTNTNGRRNPTGQPQVSTRSGDFVVPYGVTLSGRLENEINTKVSQNGDRVRMTVQSPAEYRGAVVEGYIQGVGRSGKISGQSNVTFVFEMITLRDGKTYDFAGQLSSITDATGKIIDVDNEGTIRGTNQTHQTAKRGAMGGGLGAIIGAIAGGGKGALIGAIIGAGGGASTVLVTGKDDIQLLPGSTITVQSTSPSQNYPR